MRIGFDAKRLFLNNRGLGSYARNLLYGLVKYYPQNEYELYTPKVKNEYISPSLLNSRNISVKLPTGLGKINSSIWRSTMLGSALNLSNLDVFHGLAQELPTDIRKFKGKSAVTIHDLIFLEHPEFYKPIDRWIYSKKVKFAVENADTIITISNNTKLDLIERYGLPEDRINVIYQSCDEVFYDKRSDRDKEIVRKKWNLPSDYILYVGALNENKNILAILKALAHLGNKTDIPLVVVGRGKEYRVILEDYASKHNLTNRIIYASDRANPSPLELSSFYQMASMFIFPSYYEGFGIPIIEARFSEIPVIASNSSCLDEAGGPKSYYFNPTDESELANLIEVAFGSKIHLESPPDKFRMDHLISEHLQIYQL